MTLPSAEYTNDFQPMPRLKPIINKQTNVEDIICVNQSLNQPERIVGSDFLSKDVLIPKIRNALSQETTEKTKLHIGGGVCEVISCAAQEMLYDILLRVGKQANTKINPHYDVKTTFLRTPTDELRKEFKIKSEKKPKQSKIDEYQREVVITMKDIMACKKFLPERAVHVYEKKRYESMK